MCPRDSCNSRTAPRRFVSREIPRPADPSGKNRFASHDQACELCPHHPSSPCTQPVTRRTNQCQRTHQSMGIPQIARSQKYCREIRGRRGFQPRTSSSCDSRTPGSMIREGCRWARFTNACRCFRSTSPPEYDPRSSAPDLERAQEIEQVVDRDGSIGPPRSGTIVKVHHRAPALKPA